jgi:hypothetical protein
MVNRHQHHDDSSGSSSDFFSPISIAFFRRPSSRDSQQQQHHQTTSMPSSAERRGSSTTLPPSHDNSWIGARLSPILSFDKEGALSDNDDDDADNRSEERHRAIHDTLEAAPFVVDERTSLLMRNVTNSDLQQPQYPHREGTVANGMAAANPNASKIHPLWRSPSSQQQLHGNSFHHRVMMLLRKWGCCYCCNSISNHASFGAALVTMSGIHLWAMGVYDCYQWYHWYRGSTMSVDEQDLSMGISHAWTLPLLVPSYETLALFGALAPNQVVDHGEDERWVRRTVSSYSDFLSSLLICTSVAEWLLVAGAWRLLYLASSRELRGVPTYYLVASAWYERAIIYLVSAIAGQLWMWSYDSTNELMAMGCVAWGTSGVLCATGMVHPLHRFELFTMATCLVILSLFQRPYGSVFGCTGAAFFGWALGACGFVERRVGMDAINFPGNGNDLKSTPAVTLLGTGSAVLLLSLPVLNLAFRDDTS